MAKKKQVQLQQAFQEQGKKQSWKFAVAMVGTLVLLAVIAASAQQAHDSSKQNVIKNNEPDSLLKGNVLKQINAQPNKDLVDRYGDAANDPAVADALRKAQGNNLTTDEVKAKTEAYEALQNGTFKPGTDPTMALIYGYVPPNMSPEQAAIMAQHLPKMPRMPHPPTPEEIARMAGEPEIERTDLEPASPYIPYPDSFAKAHGIDNTRQLQRIPQQNWPGQMAGMRMPYVPGMPMMGFGPGMGNGTGYGLSQQEIRAQNQRLAEECIRARYGPVNVPILQPGHNAIAEQNKRNGSKKHVAESDHQSVVGICDNNGNEITSIQYDPWGNHQVLSGGTVMPDRMYKGMFYLPRADLYMTPNRLYSAKLGRWLSRDPLGESAGTNLYAYCGNDPVNRKDPLGLYVVGTYSQSSHSFTAYDTDYAGPTFYSNDIFSGNGMFADNPFFQAAGGRGPIPQGEYFIEPKIPIPGEANFEYPLNALSPGIETFMGVPWSSRGGFTIHPGLRSNGCVTFKSKVPEDAPNYPTNPAFDALSNMLDRTNPLNVNGVNVRGILRVVP